MADNGTPSLRRQLALWVGAGAAAVTLVAGLAVTTSLWIAEQARVVEEAELLLLDQIDLVRIVDGDVVLAPVGDREFAVALDEESVVAASGDVADDVAGAIIEEASMHPDLDGDFLTVAEFEVSGSPWATAYTSCFDPTVCTTIAVGVNAPPWASFVAIRLIWIALAALAVAGAASLSAMWLVARSLRPVEAMRRELAATTATDLSRRVPVSPSGDEIEALGVTLNATLAHLESAVGANQRFVADAAHELRSPITGARAAVELRVGPDSDDLLHDALRELDRASALIDDLLFLARGRQPGIEMEDLQFRELIAHEVDALRLRAPRVRVTGDLAPVALRANRARMIRAVRNLLDNAARYGRDSIKVTLRGSAGMAVLWVDDNGGGIPEWERERVFDRFVRLDESRSRSTGGSGLGLAIVKEIVEHQQGTVSVTDSPTGGARFELRIPVR